MAEGIDPQEQARIARCRDRRLRAWPHWDELELRLRHRWSPRQVVQWFQERWPGERSPSVPTLYRFLGDQAAGWFLPELVDTRRLPRVLPLEEHAHLTVTQLLRVKRAMALEESFGLPIPETRQNIALANTLLETQFRMAQESGLEPKLGSMTPAGTGGAPREAEGRLAERIADLPKEEFLKWLHSMNREQYELHKHQAPPFGRPRGVIDVRARRVVEPDAVDGNGDASSGDTP